VDHQVLLLQAVDHRLEGGIAAPQVREDLCVLEGVVAVHHGAVAGAEGAEGPVVLAERHLVEPGARVPRPHRALLHLATWADRRRTFERVAASLIPGGRFAWNAFAFDHRTAARLDGAHQHEPVPHSVRYGVGDNRIDIVLDGGGKSSLWWATKNEWLGLVDVAGLELEALYGGFAREPFTDESREYVFVTRR